MTYDAAIVGGGVVGCAIARALSRYDLKTVLLEALGDVASGTSKANSAIVHSGYDCQPGTLMADMNVRGNVMMEELCKTLSVPFRHTGSMTLAFTEEQELLLHKLLKQGQENGVPGLSLETGDWARSREPNLSPSVRAVLWAPTASILCPYQLTVALAENAVVNGVTLLRNWRVTKIFPKAEGFTLKSASGEQIETRFLINAAGLYADDISRMAGGEVFTIRPRKGEYLLMDHRAGSTVSTVIFQTPTVMGKGVLVAPTVDGNLFAGPTSEDIDDKEDTSTTAAGAAKLKEAALRSVPSLNFGQVITGFSGLRAQRTDKHDFLLGTSQTNPRLIQAAGICSPGLTSAPAIAEAAVQALREAGLPLQEKTDFCPVRTLPKPFREMNDEERRQAILENPLYGRIICRCETVTEAEILAAIHSPVPAESIDAVKRRTRAGMGRCQGGFCMPRVMELLARELHRPLSEITKSGGASQIVTGGIKPEGGAHHG